ncbi:MAG: O-antigen ligase family protein, partial [Patescibacteria group bacterium]
IFTSRTMYPWNFGKVILFQVLVEILLVLALVYFGMGKEKRFRRLNLLDYLVLFFFGTQILSAIFGINFIRSFWGDQQRSQGIFTWLHFGVFYFLLRQFFVSRKDWENLAIWILGISFVSILLAWFGRYLPFLDGVIDKNARISGMIGNPIFLASYLIILIFLGFALFFLLEKENKWRFFGLGMGIINLITLFFTQSRGAFIGLLAGLLAIWILFSFFGSSGRFKKFIFIAGAVVLILIGGTYIFNAKSSYLKNIFPAASRLLDINLKTATAETRLMAWKIAWKSWEDKPIFGWGIENFQDAFDKHYDPGFLKHSMSETVWDRPHNYPLEVLSTYGLVGFFVYLAVVVVLFSYLAKTVKREEDGRKKFGLVILSGAGVAYIIQNCFGIESSNAMQLWFLLLALVGFYYGSGDDDFYDGKIFHKTLGWVALFFIIFTPFLIYKNYSFFQASVLMGDTRDAAEIESLYMWQKSAPRVLAAEVPFLWEQAVFLTQDLSKFDGKGILDKKTLESVAEPLSKVFDENITKQPNSFLFKFWGGQLYGYMGEYIDSKYYSRSDELLQEAWDINKSRQTVAMILAKNYLVQGRNREGIDVLEEVLSKNPDSDEVHWFFGLALMQDGQKKRGLEELERGMDFGVNFNNGNILYLINVYVEEGNYEKVISLYEILINRVPNNPQFYVSLAVAYAEIGDEDKVIFNLNKAVELQPELASEAKKFLQEKGIDINKYKN